MEGKIDFNNFFDTKIAISVNSALISALRVMFSSWYSNFSLNSVTKIRFWSKLLFDQNFFDAKKAFTAFRLRKQTEIQHPQKLAKLCNFCREKLILIKIIIFRHENRCYISKNKNSISKTIRVTLFNSDFPKYFYNTEIITVYSQQNLTWRDV